jgi:hypothetical protein
MTRRPIDDRRDAPVAAVTPGPATNHRIRFGGDRLELPAIVVAALDAAGTGIHHFLNRLQQGSIWQDSSIRSEDGEIDIQAYLAREGLRCVIRIGRGMWYHHPLGTLHSFGMRPPEIGVGENVPLICILQHELLDAIPITVTGWALLNSSKPQLGVCVHVTMPTISVDLKRDGI